MKKLEISLIRLDGGTQPRAELNHDVVTEYTDAMKSGAIFPPITVFFDGTEYWLADGFHRLQAFKDLALSVIQADILQGSLRDAVLYSTGVNAAHGLRRSNEDKRKAVMTLLLDYEWSQWSDREIARKAGVSDRFTNKLRSELRTANGSQSNLRKGVDGRTINTTNIGKSKQSSKTPSNPESPLISFHETDKSRFTNSANLENSDPVNSHQTKAEKRAEPLELSDVQPLQTANFAASDAVNDQRAENIIIDITAITIPDESNPPKPQTKQTNLSQTASLQFCIGDRIRILRRQHGEDKWTGCTAIIWEVTQNGWLRVDVEGHQGVKFTLKPEWVELMEELNMTEPTNPQTFSDPDPVIPKKPLPVRIPLEIEGKTIEIDGIINEVEVHYIHQGIAGIIRLPVNSVIFEKT
jgi:hypothetical protein